MIALALLLAGCAPKKPARAGCHLEHGKPVCVCRSLQVLSEDAKGDKSILECRH